MSFSSWWLLGSDEAVEENEDLPIVLYYLPRRLDLMDEKIRG
jgi:hypothetical protein